MKRSKERNKKRIEKYNSILRAITDAVYGYSVERIPEYTHKYDPITLFYFGDFVIQPENTLTNKNYIYVYPAKILRNLLGEYTITVLERYTVVPRYTSICTFNGNIQVSMFLPMHTQFIEHDKDKIKLQICDTQFRPKMLFTYSEYLRRR